MLRAARISPPLVAAAVALAAGVSACGGQPRTATVTVPPSTTMATSTPAAPPPSTTTGDPPPAGDPATTTTALAPPATAAGHRSARQACVDAANRTPDVGERRNGLLAFCEAIGTSPANQAREWHREGFASPRQACATSARTIPDGASRNTFLAYCDRLPNQ